MARALVSGPIVFCAFGWLIGPLALWWFDVDVEVEGLHLLAELTLALVLFMDRSAVVAALDAVPHRLAKHDSLGDFADWRSRMGTTDYA